MMPKFLDPHDTLPKIETTTSDVIPEDKSDDKNVDPENPDWKTMTDGKRKRQSRMRVTIG